MVRGRVGLVIMITELYNGPTLSQTIEDSDDRLFSSIMYNEHHLLHRLLPERHHTNYSLRSRRHDLTLSANTDRRNCIHRMTFKDMY